MTPSFLSHELYLIYNPDTDLGRKARALAPSISNIVHEIDVKSKWVTPFRWKEIIGLLNMSNPLDLLDHRHSDYAKIIAGKDYLEGDLLEILYQNPQLVKGPIGVLENHAVLCEDPNDILRLDQTPLAEKEKYTY
jgi:arsenate reductase-like glutaredoxin family protein